MTMAPDLRVVGVGQPELTGQSSARLSPEVREMLAGLPILRYLPDGVRQRVMDRVEPVSFTFGASIVREGEAADALYLLVSGRARVIKNAARDGTTNGELSLGILKPGDTFGEIALLEQTSRTLTVRASGDVDTLRID